MWTLLLLAATMWSYAHMPLGISDRNSCNSKVEAAIGPPIFLQPKHQTFPSEVSNFRVQTFTSQCARRQGCSGAGTRGNDFPTPFSRFALK